MIMQYQGDQSEAQMVDVESNFREVAKEFHRIEWFLKGMKLIKISVCVGYAIETLKIQVRTALAPLI